MGLAMYFLTNDSNTGRELQALGFPHVDKRTGSMIYREWVLEDECIRVGEKKNQINKSGADVLIVEIEQGICSNQTLKNTFHVE